MTDANEPVEAVAQESKPAEKPSAPEKKPPASSSVLREIMSGNWAVTFFAVVFALLVGAILIAGADPQVQKTAGYIFARPADFFTAVWDKLASAYTALFRGAFFDYKADSFGAMIKPITETLTVATPLILAGLAIGLPFRAGLFNIGGQGQVIIGAMTAGFLGYAVQLPPGIHLLVAIMGGMLGGALYAGFAGWLKAKTGANEVITTIMLNNIAAALILLMLKQQWFKGVASIQPISANIHQESAALPRLIPGDFRLHFGFILAILAAVFMWWLIERSKLGFQFRAVGANPHAAETAGISVARVTVLVMVVSGAFAGLAGANQVLGTELRLTAGIAGTLGFDAITVALLGRSRPLGIFLAGLLFGALSAGGRTMQAESATPIDIILVVQSVIVLLVAAPPLVRAIFRLPKPRSRSAKGKEVTA